MTTRGREPPGTPRHEPATGFTRNDDIVELQKAAADGDEGAWRALVEQFSPMVWSVCRGYRLRSADAQDVYQFVWLTLTQKLHDIKEPARLPGWLFRVAQNECLRFLGQAARQIPTDTPLDDLRVDRDDNADAAIVLAERNAELWRAVDRLPANCRSLLKALVSDPPPTYDELAARFNMPIGSVGPTRQRCLERLRRSLALIRITQDRDDL